MAQKEGPRARGRTSTNTTTWQAHRYTQRARRHTRGTNAGDNQWEAWQLVKHSVVQFRIPHGIFLSQAVPCSHTRIHSSIHYVSLTRSPDPLAHLRLPLTHPTHSLTPSLPQSLTLSPPCPLTRSLTHVWVCEVHLHRLPPGRLPHRLCHQREHHLAAQRLGRSMR